MQIVKKTELNWKLKNIFIYIFLYRTILYINEMVGHAAMSFSVHFIAVLQKKKEIIIIKFTIHKGIIFTKL